jgi:flavodoxin I
MSKILIIYSSVGGNTKLVVDSLIGFIRDLHPGITLEEVRAEQASVEKVQNLSPSDILVLASPTYGQGTLEQQMASFLKVLKGKITGRKVAVIGLGDTQYYPEYLTESSQILTDWINDNGGVLVLPALKIGTKPHAYIPKLLPRFAKSIVEKLL